MSRRAPAWRPVPLEDHGPLATVSGFALCLEAKLHTICDENGLLFVGDGRDLTDVVIRRIGGFTRGQRRIVEDIVDELFVAGALVVEGEAVRVARFIPLGRHTAPAKRASMEHRAGNDRAPTVLRPCNGSALKNEASPRNDSTHVSQIERRDRSEREDPPTPPREPGGASRVAREGVRAPVQPTLFAVPADEVKPPARAKSGGAMRAYADAYAAGIVDAAGGEFTPPTDSHSQSVFRNVLRVYAKAPDGSALAGAELLLWIRRSAAEYRRARAHKAEFESGFKPAKWQAWLDSGKVTGAPPARASPRNYQVQGAGDLDLERINRESEERARAANEEAAEGF